MAEQQTKAIEKAKQPSTMQFGGRGLVLQTITDMATFAKKAFDSGLVPDSFNSPEQVFVAIQMGAELGLRPMAALRTICVINGRPSIWGDGMLGIVRASVLLTSCEELIEGEGDSMTAICRTTRKDDGSQVERTFSVDDAKTAGLWLGANSRSPKLSPWTKFPKRMLQMRARAFCLRDHFADILSGMTSAEEAIDLQDPRASFDTNKAQGDKAENLAKRLTGATEVVAESDAQPVVEQTESKPAEQGETKPHPTPSPPAAQTSSAGQEPSTTDSAPTPPGDEGEDAEVDKRFDELAQFVAIKADIQLADAEQLADTWLKNRKYNHADLADAGRWKIVWSLAQKVDWAKYTSTVAA